MKKAVFFDRDGTVNYRIVDGYVKTIEEFSFIPDFFSFFKYVKEGGYLTIIISNQQGIGKHLMTDEELEKIHAFMQDEIRKETGYIFDDIYYCPDLKNSGSKLRKPEPGMIYNAAAKWSIDLAGSWMIGDSPNDAIAGKAAGTKTILLGDFSKSQVPDADYIFSGLSSINKLISRPVD